MLAAPQEEVIASHQRGQIRNGYVTNPDHAPAYLADVAGLWSRAYFLRQAAKAGPGTVAALTRLLDSKKIEAQGFRSCQNILDLGKRGGRQLLEQACKRLADGEMERPVSYTAVKHTITVIKTEQDQRPTTEPASMIGAGAPASSHQRVIGRDTTGAHLAGLSAFSLEALTRPTSDTAAQEVTDV